MASGSLPAKVKKINHMESYFNIPVSVYKHRHWHTWCGKLDVVLKEIDNGGSKRIHVVGLVIIEKISSTVRLKNVKKLDQNSKFAEAAVFLVGTGTNHSAIISNAKKF
ncbi:hypothetical protein YC2023_084304 [Brassica napus]